MAHGPWPMAQLCNLLKFANIDLAYQLLTKTVEMALKTSDTGFYEKKIRPLKYEN